MSILNTANVNGSTKETLKWFLVGITLHEILVDAICGAGDAYSYLNTKYTNCVHVGGNQWNPEFYWRKKALKKLHLEDLMEIYYDIKKAQS